MYYVYLLKSKVNNELYTGSTNDLARRLQEHNNGKEISTKRYKPWEIIYYEAYKEESLARMREQKLKYNGNAIREVKKRARLFKSGAGFTLIELLIYSVIFAFLAIMLIYFLALFFRASNQQISSSEVANQANFILQKIQGEIANASFLVVNDDGNDEVDGTLSEPHTTLVIKDRAENTAGASDPASPIKIYKTASSTVALQRGNQAQVILNNASVNVTNLKFTKVSTPPGRDVVMIDLTLQYNSPNLQQQITRQFLLGVGKAVAATFDTPLNPSTSTLDIGTGTLKWKNLFLSGDLSIDGKIVWNAGAAPDNSINFLKQGMVSIDPPSITTTSPNWTTAKTVTGTQTGDRVFVTAPSDLESGLVFIGAKITASSTLSITLRNITASTITDASTTARNWPYFIIR